MVDRTSHGLEAAYSVYFPNSGQALFMGLFASIRNLFSRSRTQRDFDQSSMQDAPSGWELPPLTAREAEAVLTQSEYAALEATPDDGTGPNPHLPGSREHRLWEENFQAVRRAFGKKR